MKLSDRLLSKVGNCGGPSYITLDLIHDIEALEKENKYLKSTVTDLQILYSKILKRLNIGCNDS